MGFSPTVMSLASGTGAERMVASKPATLLASQRWSKEEGVVWAERERERERERGRERGRERERERESEGGKIIT